MVAKGIDEEVFLGNSTLLAEKQIQLSPELLSVVTAWEVKGATPVFIGKDTYLAGIIFLRDQLRPETKLLFSALSKKGYEVVIITGDKKEVAETIVKELPGTNFIVGVTPEGKVREVEKKRNEGRNIIMVGDGINDAPALAKAQVGIAMGGKGVDITLNAADIVLLNNNIASIPTMIDISKKTFRIIKEDVVIATVIHIITAVLVLSGSISLLQTTIIHEISSIIVLLNTLRLFKVKLKN